MHTAKLNKILEKCKLQERGAQFELYKLYSKAMYNICLRMMKQEADAEDVLQESFVKAFKNINSYKYDATFGAWLKRIVINSCISSLKKRKVFFQDIEDQEFVAEESPKYDDVQLEVGLVRKAIDILPVGYRTIFTMYALEGFDHEEIGEVLGISIGTSKSQYSRAKSKLKEILSNQDRVSKIS